MDESGPEEVQATSRVPLGKNGLFMTVVTASLGLWLALLAATGAEYPPTPVLVAGSASFFIGAGFCLAYTFNRDDYVWPACALFATALDVTAWLASYHVGWQMLVFAVALAWPPFVLWRNLAYAFYLERLAPRTPDDARGE